MKASPRRLALVALAAGLLVVAGLALMTWWNHSRVQDNMTSLLTDARQLQIAIQMRVLDAQDDEFPRGLLPADVGAKSARDYFARLRLVENNYLSAADFEKFRESFGVSGPLAIANVSRDDPPDTALVVMKNSEPGSSRFVVFTRGGSGGVYERPSDATKPQVFRLPPREPAILPAE